MTTDVPQPIVRAADRGAATRAALLAAAREVFTSAGYAQAGVTDIVAAAGASVGSLYHHFTGKADLYVTLFEEFHQGQVPVRRVPLGLGGQVGRVDTFLSRRLVLGHRRDRLPGVAVAAIMRARASM